MVMERKKENKKPNKINKILKLGANLASTTLGVSTAVFLSPILGPIASGVLGSTVQGSLKDISERFLSPKEQARIGGTVIFALEQINKRLEKGDKFREDGFIDDLSNNAEEAFEGCLIAAKNSHEEKKVIYLGNLFANLCFENRIAKQQANIIVSTASGLTYLELCILVIFLHEQDKKLIPFIEHNFTKNQATFEQIVVLKAISDLQNAGLLIVQDQHTFYFNEVTPNKVHTQGIGAALCELMELKKIPSKDILDAINPILKKNLTREEKLGMYLFFDMWDKDLLGANAKSPN